MTRIGTIREIVERNGGTVDEWYSDGPVWRLKRSTSEWYQASGYSMKLITDISPDAMKKVLNELNVWGVLAYDVRKAYITRKYKNRGGHLKVVFNSAYSDFKRGIKS